MAAAIVGLLAGALLGAPGIATAAGNRASHASHVGAHARMRTHRRCPARRHRGGHVKCKRGVRRNVAPAPGTPAASVAPPGTAPTTVTPPAGVTLPAGVTPPATIAPWPSITPPTTMTSLPETLVPLMSPSPVSATPPTIAGRPIVGQTLNASSGTWTGEPASFGYQWQDCNSAGESCASVGGATLSSRTLAAGDAGRTVRVLVTATAASGEGTATSAPTAVVAAATAGQPTGCFGREEACGYPGPEDTGVEKGSTLTTHTGDVVVSEPGTTLHDERIEGNLEIAASNVTVENVEVVTHSQKEVCENAGDPEGGGGLVVREHGGELSTGIVIRHVTVHGVTQGCPESLGEGIAMRESSSAGDVRVQWSKVYWTRMCFFQSATWENNYCDDNGALPGAHYDGIYDNGEGTVGSAQPGLIVKHNTILMPHWQTAPLFLPNEKEVGEERVEDNLLAGGGYLMYLPGADAPAVRGPIEVLRNRYARCSGTEASSQAGGHHLCEGLPEEDESTGSPPTGDAQGFFPRGGSYGVLYPAYDTSADTLSGNYWDDNLEAAP